MKKSLLAAILGIALALGIIFAGCKLDAKSCPRSDNCSGDRWCSQSSCNARYSDVRLPCNCGD